MSFRDFSKSFLFSDKPFEDAPHPRRFFGGKVLFMWTVTHVGGEAFGFGFGP
jgi:hypothetical protein